MKNPKELRRGSGNLSGKLFDKRHSSGGKHKHGKHGKGSKKTRDRTRSADRAWTWKSIETRVFVLGIHTDGALSRNRSGEIVTQTPTALSPRTLSHALSEPSLRGSICSYGPALSSCQSNNSMRNASMQLPQPQSVPSPHGTSNRSEQRKLFREMMKSHMQPKGNAKLLSLLKQAKDLLQQLQVNTSPQLATATWQEREQHLRILEGTQKQQEAISRQLMTEKWATGGTEQDEAVVQQVWSAVWQVSAELALLSRNCCVNVGHALNHISCGGHREVDCGALRWGISLGVRTVKLMSSQHDRIGLDRYNDPSGTDECKSREHYTCMAEGSYEVMEGMLHAARLVLHATVPPPAQLDLVATHDRRQALLRLWANSCELMKMVTKLATSNGMLETQPQYVRMVEMLVEEALSAADALRDAVSTPLSQAGEEALISQCWVPDMLAGVLQLSEAAEHHLSKLGPDSEAACGEHSIPRALCRLAQAVSQQACHLTSGIDFLMAPLSNRGLQAALELTSDGVAFVSKVCKPLMEDNEDEVEEEVDRLHLTDEQEEDIQRCTVHNIYVVEAIQQRLEEQAEPEDDSIFGDLDEDMLLTTPRISRGSHHDTLSPFADMGEPAPQAVGGRPCPTLSVRVPDASGRAGPRMARLPSEGIPGGLPDGARIGRALRGDLNSIPKVTNEQLHLQSPLGTGSFGVVWRGFWHDSNIPVAVKVVGRYTGGSLLPYMKTGDLASIEAEWDACHCLANHDNLVTFHQVVWWSRVPRPGNTAPKPPTEEHLLCFVMEYCGYGNLWELLRDASSIHKARRAGEQVEGGKSRGHTFYKHWLMRLDIAHQIALGLQFMHSHGRHGFVHRDLTSANVMLTHGFRENPSRPGSMSTWIKAKICDYGFARLMEADTLRTVIKASCRWQAPEVLDPDSSEVHYSRAADVYSFGVILWEIMTLRAPWSEFEAKCCDYLVAEAVGRNKEQLQWPDDPADLGPHLHTRAQCQALATRCWAADPEDRPTIQEVADELAHIRNEEQAEVLAADQLSRSGQRGRQAAGE